MRIRKGRVSNPMVVAMAGICFTAACDSGSEVAVGDWRAFETRLAVLEADNADLRAELADKLTIEDLEGYTPGDACAACVKPDDIKDFITLAEVPATDISGLATSDELAAVEAKIPDTEGFLTQADLTPYAKSAGLFDDYMTRKEIEDNYSTTAQSDARYDTRYLTQAVADERYATDAELFAYIDPSELDTIVTAKLAPYLTDADLTPFITKVAADATYATKNALSAYIDQPELTAALTPYLTSAALTPYLTTAVGDATYAFKGDLPNLALYAKLTDLSAYVKTSALPDFTTFALKTELTSANLSLYALKTDLPNLASYALKSEIPSLSGYVQESALAAYALDSDLDQYDDVIHLIDTDVVKNIPSVETPTLEAAFAWADHFSVSNGHTLTFQLADGTYTFNDNLTAVHRDGGRIRILGNVADPTKVVLDFSAKGGGIVVRMGRLGLLDGVTIKGKRNAAVVAGCVASPRDAANACDLPANGVQAIEGGVIKLGDNVIVQNFFFTGVRATTNGYVLASGVESNSNGQDGFAAVDGGVVSAFGSSAETNARHGFNAAIGGVIDGENMRAKTNGSQGVRAFGASMVYARGGSSTDNTSHGVTSLYGSHVYFENGIADDNKGHGINVSLGASVEALNVSADGNLGIGINAGLGSAVNAQNSNANGKSLLGTVAKQQTGYSAFLGSAMNVQGSEARHNLSGPGFSAGLGSAMNAGPTVVGTGVNMVVTSTVADDNAGGGFSAGNGSAMSAVAAQAIHNGFNGFAASLNSSIDAYYHVASGTITKADDNDNQGFGSWMSSAISADGASSTNNGNDGFHTNTGGVLSAGLKRDPTNTTVVGQALAELNGGNGYGNYQGGVMTAQGAHAINNSGSGFLAHNNSSLITHYYDDESQQPLARNNGGAAFDTYMAGVIDAGQATVDNPLRKPFAEGFRAGIGSLIQANGSSVDGTTNNAYDAYFGSTIQADDSAATNITNGGGYNAHNGSLISAAGSEANVTSRAGYAASNLSAVYASDATATDTNEGFTAHHGSYMDAVNATSIGARLGAFTTNDGATMDATDADAIGTPAGGGLAVTDICFNSQFGSMLRAQGATATDCTQSCFNISDGSSAWTMNASATGCGNDGFSVNSNSSLSGPDMRVNGTTYGSGFSIMGGSFMYGPDAQSVNAGFDGFRIGNGSFLDATSSDFYRIGTQNYTPSSDPNDYAMSTDSGQLGVNVFQNSYAQIPGFKALRNGTGGFAAGQASGVAAQWSTATGKSGGTGMGGSANGNSYLDLNYSTINANRDGGMWCGASFCMAMYTTFTNNSGGQYQEYAANAGGDAWFEVSGATSSGHDFEVNAFATRTPNTWFTIFNSLLPINP